MRVEITYNVYAGGNNVKIVVEGDKDFRGMLEDILEYKFPEVVALEDKYYPFIEMINIKVLGSKEVEFSIGECDDFDDDFDGSFEE